MIIMLMLIWMDFEGSLESIKFGAEIVQQHRWSSGRPSSFHRRQLGE
jgi:hypothetical protein